MNLNDLFPKSLTFWSKLCIFLSISWLICRTRKVHSVSSKTRSKEYFSTPKKNQMLWCCWCKNALLRLTSLERNQSTLKAQKCFRFFKCFQTKKWQSSDFCVWVGVYRNRNYGKQPTLQFQKGSSFYQIKTKTFNKYPTSKLSNWMSTSAIGGCELSVYRAN